MGRDWVAIGRRYARDVISGGIPACRWVRLACARSERDLERFAGGDAVYRFDGDRANAVCDFVSGLRHVQDSIHTRAGEPFEPLPWQAWILTTVFGWVWRDTGTRRFHRCYVEEGRGNGKSTLASGVVLYATFAEGVGGAQAVCAASLKDQARIVLDTARQMVEQDEDLRQQLGLEVLANKIVQPRTNSRLWALPAKASSAEGLSINVGVLDEVHAQRGRSLHDTLASGCSKRENSFFLMVTTAGDDSAGIAFEIHSFAERVLAGEAEDDSFFAAMYTIDTEDEWADPAAHRKANPSWGVSVDPRAIAEECRRAQQIPGARANFRTKHLCEWIQNGGGESFLDDRDVRRCYDPHLDEAQFLGQAAAYGADLASRLDMCAAYRVHVRRVNEKPHYYAFGRSWLPETQRKANVAYEAWVARGELVITPGATTDHDAIEAFLAAEMEKYKVRDVSFDPLQSAMLVSHLAKRGGAMVEIAQSAKYLTPGVLELQEAVAGGRLHTNSQLLVWALGNLRIRTIGSNMLQPVRPVDHDRKIDAAVALIMALRSAALVPLDEVKRAPHVYVFDNYGVTDVTQRLIDREEAQAKLQIIPKKEEEMKMWDAERGDWKKVSETIEEVDISLVSSKEPEKKPAFDRAAWQQLRAEQEARQAAACDAQEEKARRRSKLLAALPPGVEFLIRDENGGQRWAPRIQAALNVVEGVWELLDAR